MGRMEMDHDGWSALGKPIALRVLTRCHMPAILNTRYARQRNPNNPALLSPILVQPSQAKLAPAILDLPESLADPSNWGHVASRDFAPTPEEHEWIAMGYPPIHTNQNPEPDCSEHEKSCLVLVYAGAGGSRDT